MTFEEKISVWKKVYGEIYKVATQSKTYPHKGFFEFCKQDSVGAPLWMGNDAASEWNRYDEKLIQKYYFLDWGRIIVSDRAEFVKLLTALNKSLEGVNVGISYEGSWNWQDVEYKNEMVHVAKKTYELMFSLSIMPFKERLLDLSRVCLSAHRLPEIGDCFSIFEKFGAKDRIGSYSWRSYGLLIGTYSSFGKNTALKIKDTLEKFFEGDEFFDRIAISLDVKKEKARQSYLIHVIFSDVKDGYEKLNLKELIPASKKSKLIRVKEASQDYAI